jgi:hypothetical protein
MKPRCTGLPLPIGMQASLAALSCSQARQAATVSALRPWAGIPLSAVWLRCSCLDVYPVCFVLGGYGVCSLCAIMQLTEISRCLGSVTRNDVADMPTSGKLMPAHPWMGHTAPSMLRPSVRLSVHFIHLSMHLGRCVVTIAVRDKLQGRKLNWFVCGPRQALVCRGFRGARVFKRYQGARRQAMVTSLH